MNSSEKRYVAGHRAMVAQEELAKRDREANEAHRKLVFAQHACEVAAQELALADRRYAQARLDLASAEGTEFPEKAYYEDLAAGRA